MMVRPAMRSYCGQTQNCGMFRHATVQLRHNACPFHRDTKVRGLTITISTIYLPTYLLTLPSINQPTNQFTHKATNQSINQTTNLPISQSINQTIHQSTNLFINKPTNPPLYSSTYLSIQPASLPSTNKSITQSISLT